MSHIIEFDIYLNTIQNQQNKLEKLNTLRPKNKIFNIIENEYNQELEENPEQILFLKYKYYWKNELFVKICKGQNAIEELENLDKCYSKKQYIFPTFYQSLSFKKFSINEEIIKLYIYVHDQKNYYFVDFKDIFNLEIFKKVNIFSTKRYLNRATKNMNEIFEYGIRCTDVQTEGFERWRFLITARGVYKFLATLIEQNVFEIVFGDRVQNSFREIIRILSIASKLSYSYFK